MPASAIASASAIAAAAADVAAQRAAAQMHGVFAVNKPAGISCTGVLDYLKRNLGRGAAAEPFAAHFEREAQLRATGRKIRRPRTALDLRVGHGGTLDVEAAGVLVVGLGRGCKRLDGFLRGPKAYVADARLGVATDTHDAEGRVTRLADAAHVDAPRLRQALPRFTGDIWQRPPAFSAARVDGRRLYEYARAGELPPTEPKARCVHVASISLARLANPAGGHWLGSRAGALPADAAQYYAGGRRQWAEGRGQPAVGDVLLPWPCAAAAACTCARWCTTSATASAPRPRC
ncbi:pseudouridine synthase pus4 [Coemansia erecta]|uniref:tRNA pseudouridine(55) synthase n=1 Tax=Coemansia erecta TaxID=147472 RepID=A0A9W8CQJ5_9FUNG|nr:pseudouridine synthase pus4 [Coemansia erecta]